MEADWEWEVRNLVGGKTQAKEWANEMERSGQPQMWRRENSWSLSFRIDVVDKAEET